MSAEPLRFRFLPALLALVEDEIEEGRLNYSFGHRARCGSRVNACDFDAVSRAVRQQLGRGGWPLQETDLLDREIVSLVQLFAGAVVHADPLLCSYCEQYHIDFGRPAGEEFQQAVNGLFVNLALPLRIVDGKVVNDRSEVLSRAAADLAGLTDDPILMQLVSAAVDDFFNGGDDRRRAGLEKIVDAFERTKASLAADKKRSVAELLRTMSPYPKIAEAFEQLVRQLTETGNSYSIRHYEPGQQPLNDVHLVEFLFFSYFNLVRFALTKIATSGSAA